MRWGLREGVVKDGEDDDPSTTILRRLIRSMIRKILEIIELSKFLVS